MVHPCDCRAPYMHHTQYCYQHLQFAPWPRMLLHAPVRPCAVLYVLCCAMLCCAQASARMTELQDAYVVVDTATEACQKSLPWWTGSD